jgi:HD superfamily phosphohydrolase
MRLALISLLRGEDFIGLLNQTNIELALLAALLSNLSKYPFSFIVKEIQDRNYGYYSSMSSQKIFDDLLSLENESGNSLRKIIQTNFKDCDLQTLSDLVNSKSDFDWPSPIRIINKLINSTIDVRVIDFLQRDSYHIGISHGSHINFDSLVENICIHDGTLAVTSRGVTDVEQVVTLRYWLYKRIYWNYVNRAYASVLTYLFFELYNVTDFEKRLIGAALLGDNNEVLAFLENEVQKIEPTNKNLYLKLNNLLKTVNTQTPSLFKEVYLINQTESSSAQFDNICDKFSKMTYTDITILSNKLEKRLSKYITFSENHVNILIDIPPIEPKKKLGEDITVKKNDGSESSIKNMSGLIEGISNTFDANLRFLRIYINPAYEEEIKKDERGIKETIHSFLMEHSE